MEQLQVPLVDATAALGGSSSVVTLAQVSDSKTVEVRADGIYETTNQQEAATPTATLSRQTSASSSVSPSVPFEKPESSCEDPVVVSNASPPDELKTTEPPESAYSSFDDVEVPELQAGSDQAVEHSVAIESEDSVSSSVVMEQIPTEELQNNNPSPPPSTRVPEDTSSGSSEPTAAPISSQDLKAKPDNRESGSVDEATLSKVQDFLIVKKKLHFPSLIQRIVAHFNRDALAQGREDVSVDVQSSICLLEQTFLTFGRVSPLQDMYTAEEEDLLDQLGVLSGRSDGSPRSTSS